MAIHHSVNAYDYAVKCSEAKPSENEAFEVGEIYAVDCGNIIDDNGQKHMVYAGKEAVFTNFARFEY